jgi:polysaccharide biosynthesis transport protein
MNVKYPQEIMQDTTIDDSGIELREYLNILSNYKWAIITLSFTITILSALYIYSQTPVYRATATIVLDPQKQNVISIQEVYGLPSVYYEYYQTQIQIIKSRELLGRVVDQVNLKPESLVIPASQKPKFSFNWRSWIPDSWLPQPETTPVVNTGKKDPRDAIINQLAGMLDVSLVSDSQLVKISFDSHNPKLTAELANALAEVYIESGLVARLETTRNASEWITEHLKDLKQEVDESSHALQTFLEKEKLVDAQGVDSIAVRELDDVSTELVEASQKRSEAQELYRQVTALQGQPLQVYESIPAVLRDPQVHSAKTTLAEAERKVSELADRYGPKHPKMIAAVAELDNANKNMQAQIRNVIESVKKEYEVAKAKESHLILAKQSAKNEISDINRKSNELKILEQELASNRQLYDMFLTRFKETSITDDLKTTDARIVDRAQVPGAPYKPDTQRFITISFITALMFSIILVFIIESLDNTLNTTGQVENKLFLPVLGILPKLNIWLKKDIKAMRYFTDKKHSSFSENIRTIRTSVLLNDIDSSKKIILVTSSVPEEGKSIVAVNLALALAQMAKTLLIDADMRKPSIEKVFGMKKNEPGLTHFIAGTHELKACMHYFEDEKLHVMPAGQIPSNPLELLSSSRFEKTATGLLQYYDYIVFDSAPAIPVSDPVVLSRIADVTIYVVKADSTPFQLAKTGIKKLNAVNAKILGVVLNQVNPAKRPKRYGYGESDYYTYYGYHQS